MKDEDVFTSFVLSKGDFVGECLRCSEPTTGSYDSDDEENYIKMKCVNCGYKQHVEFDNKFDESAVVFEG